MKIPREQTVTKLMLIIVIGFSISMWFSLRRLHTGIETVIQQQVNQMQTITQEATNTAGKTATISTVRKEGESIQDWLARHQAAVDAFEDT